MQSDKLLIRQCTRKELESWLAHYKELKGSSLSNEYNVAVKEFIWTIDNSLATSFIPYYILLDDKIIGWISLTIPMGLTLTQDQEIYAEVRIALEADFSGKKWA